LAKKQNQDNQQSNNSLEDDLKDVKRLSSAKKQFLKLLSSEQKSIQRAFLSMLRRVDEDLSDAQIEKWVREKDIRAFVKFFSDYVEEFAAEMPKSFVRAARKEIESLTAEGAFGVGKVKIGFDPGDKAAAKTIEASRLRLVREMKNTQKDAVRSAISRSLKMGHNPKDAAREFRNSIGLTRNQLAAVDNYQDALERGSTQALDRALRDKRFDSTV
jgi:hypothetical protein